MNGFIGTETHSIDQKGRIAIPAAMRRKAAQALSGSARPEDADATGETQAATGTTFIIVMGFEGCLALYTQDGWRKIRERLEQLPLGEERRGHSYAHSTWMRRR